jgi:hypothetical protein
MTNEFATFTDEFEAFFSAWGSDVGPTVCFLEGKCGIDFNVFRIDNDFERHVGL